jgi:hypothetical protein
VQGLRAGEEARAPCKCVMGGNVGALTCGTSGRLPLLLRQQLLEHHVGVGVLQRVCARQGLSFFCWIWFLAKVVHTYTHTHRHTVRKAWTSEMGHTGVL